jgi:uncharacterized protein (TIRG00374 family)
MLVVAFFLVFLRARGQHHPRLRTHLHRAREALFSVTVEQLGILFALSLLILVVRAFVIYFLVLAAGSFLGPSEAAMVVAYATLIALVPISFGGLGMREGVVSSLLVYFSIGYEKALLVALLGRLFIVMMAAGGGACLAQEMIKAKRV